MIKTNNIGTTMLSTITVFYVCMVYPQIIRSSDFNNSCSAYSALYMGYGSADSSYDDFLEFRV